MKKLAIVGLMLASSVALAKKDDWIIRYQCQAKGKTSAGQTQVLQGWQRNTVAEAKTSAIQMCNKNGLSGCSIKACYERRF